MRPNPCLSYKQAKSTENEEHLVGWAVLIHAIWFHHPPLIKHWYWKNSYTWPNDHVTVTHTVAAVHQTAFHNNSLKISKVMQGNTSTWSSTQARSTVKKARKNNSGAEFGQTSPFCVIFVSKHNNSRSRTLNISFKATLQEVGRNLSHVWSSFRLHFLYNCSVNKSWGMGATDFTALPFLG